MGSEQIGAWLGFLFGAVVTIGSGYLFAGWASVDRSTVIVCSLVAFVLCKCLWGPPFPWQVD